MKVAHIIETPGTGGAENVLIDIATRLPAAFTSVGVMMCDSWTGNELAKRGIPVTVMPLRKSFDFGWPLRFARFLSAEKIDVVQSHEFTANVYATAGARLAGVPIVCTTHGKNYWPHALYRRAAYRWVARNARAFVAVSTDLGDFATRTLGIPGRRVRVIRNGIDLERYRRDEVARARLRAEIGIRGDQSLLLACGELSEVKGHEWLIRAAPRLISRHPGVLIAIAGEGALREKLQALAVELGVAGNIRFLGFRRDVPQLLSAADVFVMPSLSEGLPLAILESMAAMTPVVATRVGGMPELIRPGETGWLVAPADAAELGDVLATAISDAPGRQQRAARALELCAREYGLQATIDCYAALYRHDRKGQK